MKRPSRVSTFTRSPAERYGGTRISIPVSSRAGLSCAYAVAPLRAGAVSTTSSSTVTGSSTVSTCPL